MENLEFKNPLAALDNDYLTNAFETEIDPTNIPTKFELYNNAF